MQIETTQKKKSSVNQQNKKEQFAQKSSPEEKIKGYQQNGQFRKYTSYALIINNLNQEGLKKSKSAEKSSARQIMHTQHTIKPFKKCLNSLSNLQLCLNQFEKQLFQKHLVFKSKHKKLPQLNAKTIVLAQNKTKQQNVNNFLNLIISKTPRLESKVNNQKKKDCNNKQQQYKPGNWLNIQPAYINNIKQEKAQAKQIELPFRGYDKEEDFQEFSIDEYLERNKNSNLWQL